MSQLPEGWIATKLTEVCALNPAKPKSDQITSDLPVTFVPMAAVDAESGTIANPSIREYSAVAKGFTSFQENDVIMAKITPCMENGKAAIARRLSNGIGFGSTEFHVFRPSTAMLPEYVFHFIRQESFRKSAEANMTGSVGQKRVPASFLNEYDFPLPPLDEQRRIVAKLETLLSKVAAYQQRMAKIPMILKRFRQAVLAAACSGRLTADWRDSTGETVIQNVTEQNEDRPFETPDSWTWGKLPSLGYLGRGRSKHRPRDAEHLYGGPYPFIQTGDIARSGGRITQHKQTYSEAGLAQSKLWPEGTVCITIAANIADSALLTYPACFPDSVVGLITDGEICLPEYAEFFMRTARNDLAQFAPATAQKNINLSILNDVMVPLPPLTEQREIVRHVETLSKLADQIESHYQNAKTQVDKLPQSILAKAFRGELVPTEAELARREGRDYEPASVLLERIRSERAEHSNGRKEKAGSQMKPIKGKVSGVVISKS